MKTIPMFDDKPDAAAHGVRFTILGEPASKANSREIGLLKFTDKATGIKKSRPMVRKSDKAIAYVQSALRQIPPPCRVMFDCPVFVAMTIFYASERPDLDETVILDVLQAQYIGKGADRSLAQRGVYLNDRQVRARAVFHAIDKVHPRAEIVVVPLIDRYQTATLAISMLREYSERP